VGVDGASNCIRLQSRALGDPNLAFLSSAETKGLAPPAEPGQAGLAQSPAQRLQAHVGGPRDVLPQVRRRALGLATPLRKGSPDLVVQVGAHARTTAALAALATPTRLLPQAPQGLAHGLLGDLGAVLLVHEAGDGGRPEAAVRVDLDLTPDPRTMVGAVAGSNAWADVASDMSSSQTDSGTMRSCPSDQYPAQEHAGWVNKEARAHHKITLKWQQPLTIKNAGLLHAPQCWT